jgi:hypothetical protein
MKAPIEARQCAAVRDRLPLRCGKTCADDVQGLPPTCCERCSAVRVSGSITRRFGNQPAHELRQDQAVSTASFALIASTAAFSSAETPGIASTLSNSLLRDGMIGLTNPATTFRCSGDNCPLKL